MHQPVYADANSRWRQHTVKQPLDDSDSDDTQVTVSTSESQVLYHIRPKHNGDKDDFEDNDDDSLFGDASVEEEEAYQNERAKQIRRNLQEAKEIKIPRIEVKQVKHDERSKRTLIEDAGNSRPSLQASEPDKDQLLSDQLTFYGKPVFESATEMDVLKERSDNSGTMPYRVGKLGPWLSSLRRPINYTELQRQETKQQRCNKKFEDRYPHKNYTEIFTERKAADIDANVAESSVVASTAVTNPPVFLPPISQSVLSSPPPVTVTTSREGQKVNIDINLVLPTSRHQLEASTHSQDFNSIPQFQMTSRDNLSSHCQITARDNVPPLHLTTRDQPTHKNMMSLQPATLQAGVSLSHGKYPQSCRHLMSQPVYSSGVVTTRGYQSMPMCCQTKQNGHCYQSQQQLSMASCSCPLCVQHTQQQVAMTTRPEPMNKLKAHRHVKHGRYGEYRVFCVNDYNKLKREMKLASSLAAEDAETLNEKREKLAVQQGYGKLVSDRNRQEQLRAKRQIAETMIVQ